MTHSAQTVAQALGLLAAGRSTKSVAKQLGISTHAVRTWSLRNPEELLAQRAAAGEHDRAMCSLIAELPLAAYAYLLGQYLGDGSIARHRRDVYRLSITTCDDYPIIRERVAASVEAVIGRTPGLNRSVGCADVNAYSKHWPCLFPQHGPGMKHTRLIELAQWQEAIVREETREFVAGLIHSDGCRSINRVNRSRNRRTKTYEYPRYFFSNQSMDILHICGDALDLLGVEWRFNNKNSISVARKASVAILDEFIGPKT